MRMKDLWGRIGETISEFVQRPKIAENAFVMWKLPILSSEEENPRCTKTIVSVPSLDAANALKHALEKTLSEPELLVYDDTLKKRPYKLKIKIINCPETAGQLILKKSNIPVTMHNLSATDVRYIISTREEKEIDSVKHNRPMCGCDTARGVNSPLNVSKSLKEQIEEISSRYAQLIADAKLKQNKNAKYCINYIKPYATSYRITYTDNATRRRKQTAVGDVLIVVHGTEVVEDKRITKPRSDIFFTKHRDKHIASAPGIGIFAEWEHNVTK